MNSNGANPPDVVVFGQIARDLVFVVDEVPGAGHSAAVRQRREMLGGKGANQAVALAQLGMCPALVGVVGDDRVGQRLLEQARQDRVDVSAAIVRAGTATALIADVVDGSGRWRYLEDIPAATLLTRTDVLGCARLLVPGCWASLQLQQPPTAALAAARLAREAGCKIALDGVPGEQARAELLATADVLRADAREAGLLTGTDICTAAEAERAARDIVRRGPSLVALAVNGIGNAFAWHGGSLQLPLSPTQVVDTTGAGDAFMAALIMGLARGGGPQRAARLAVAAAGATVGHPGGRPALTPTAVQQQLTLLARAAPPVPGSLMPPGGAIVGGATS
ncbi:MAG: bifunctional hydroxymethylpyrimidine kinase/phosphomethylpyrimidine kinase [Streptosporangiaceae bacterium]|nr:bifunctional hydroxymethylpyrimidine kinase/phosphomethylpyrimidine kinase [Streptosporangiaceae bacterium]